MKDDIIRGLKSDNWKKRMLVKDIIKQMSYEEQSDILDMEELRWFKEEYYLLMYNGVSNYGRKFDHKDLVKYFIDYFHVWRNGFCLYLGTVGDVNGIDYKLMFKTPYYGHKGKMTNKYPNIRKVDLSGNGIKKIDDSFCNLENLEELDLNYNNMYLTDECVNNLSKLNKLKYLNFNNNNISHDTFEYLIKVFKDRELIVCIESLNYSYLIRDFYKCINKRSNLRFRIPYESKMDDYIKKEERNKKIFR